MFTISHGWGRFRQFLRDHKVVSDLDVIAGVHNFILYIRMIMLYKPIVLLQIIYFKINSFQSNQILARPHFYLRQDSRINMT